MAAWAPIDRDPSASTAWEAARAAAQTIVAVEDDGVIGFSDLVHGDLLDMLYASTPCAGGCGLGSALLREMVSIARAHGLDVIKTDASLTARPVFERNGFVVIEQRTRPGVIRGTVRDDQLQDGTRSPNQRRADFCSHESSGSLDGLPGSAHFCFPASSSDPVSSLFVATAGAGPRFLAAVRGGGGAARMARDRVRPPTPIRRR